MLIQSVHKGSTVTEVVILDVNNYSNEELFETARNAAREAEHSLFGWHVKRYPVDAAATVSLYTD